MSLAALFPTLQAAWPDVEYDRKFDGGYDRIFYRKQLANRRAGNAG